VSRRSRKLEELRNSALQHPKLPKSEEVAGDLGWVKAEEARAWILHPGREWRTLDGELAAANVNVWLKSNNVTNLLVRKQMKEFAGSRISIARGSYIHAGGRHYIGMSLKVRFIVKYQKSATWS